MKESRRKPNVSIRINPEILHQAKVAAVSSKKTLGDWLEEAIQEKVERK
jgi:predicted HicB family RNase H-like nuclease